MPLQAFSSLRVVLADGIRPATLLVEGGKIRSIASHGQIPNGCQVHDFGNNYLLPGLVDTHVHINEPGRTEWEGFATATCAAAAGGYTTLVDMPLNCLPETTTVAALHQKRRAAQGKCRVDWAAWGGVVADNQQHILPLAAEGVPGYKCFLVYPGIEGFTMVDREQLRRAMPHVAESGLPLLVHAELEGPLETAAKHLNDADWRQYATYLASRPEEAELEAIEWMLSLSREFGSKIHIVHLSSAKALDMLRAARVEGLPITVETCPHYLHFTAEQIPDGATLFKCAPPIRQQANRERLWQGLKEGIIDLIATDHSPCPPEMKRLEEGNFQRAWGGIASLSIGFSVIWTEARTRGLAITDLVRWMSTAPAKLAGLDYRKGLLAEGYDADLVAFDPEAKFTVTPEGLYYRHPVSPYLGEELFGSVKATILGGVPVFAEGWFPGEPPGKELRR